MGAIGAVAAAIGPTLGAALVEAGGWRWVFVINLPIGIITIALGRHYLDESADPTAVLPSPLGIALVTLGSVLLSLGLVQSEVWGWDSARTVSSLLGGALVLGLFVLHQSTHFGAGARPQPLPVLEFQMGQRRRARLWNGLHGDVLVQHPVSHQRVAVVHPGGGIRGCTRPDPGGDHRPVPGPLFGQHRTTPDASFGRSVLCIRWCLASLGAHCRPDYVTDYLPSMLFTGLGVALCLPQLSSVVGQSLPLNRLGVGGAVNQAFRQFGGTLGVGPRHWSHRPVDRVWWILILGGLATTLLSIPLDTKPAQPALLGAPA